MDFKNIEKQYRPTPFWSWNEKLNTDETIRRIKMLDEVFSGGFFIKAKKGLETRYMGDEWFRNVSLCVEEAASLGMQVWICDETATEGGFNDGSISSAGIEFQQKFLCFETGEKTNDRTITYKDGYHFYYDVNPFCPDLLNEKVSHEIIEKSYMPYYERYKDKISGFFAPRMQLGNQENHIPWSFMLPSAYKNEYGEELLDKLIELFRPVGDYKETRLKFWRLITKLFSENAIKPLYEWCTQRNLLFKGSLKNENMCSQIPSCGSAMTHFEYFTTPCIEWKNDEIYDSLMMCEAWSVSCQMGKKEVFAKLFSEGQHEYSLDELKKISSYLMTFGVTNVGIDNLLYSLRGERKRENSFGETFCKPSWEKYKVFNETSARAGMLLSKGEVVCDTLLINNISSVWKNWDADKNTEARELESALLRDCKALWEKHIIFHLGDELLMEKHACVDGDTLIIGKKRYKTVVIPENDGFLPSTQKLLSEFERGGGIIITTSDIIEDDICDSPKIMYTKRAFDGFLVHIFTNCSDENTQVSFKRGSKKLDIVTCEVLEFYGKHTFSPYETLFLIDDGTPFSEKGFELLSKPLDTGGMWNVTECTENIMRLCKCDVYLNEKLTAENENAHDVIRLLLEQTEKTNVRCDFKFNVKSCPQEIFLYCEDAQNFDIKLNGEALLKEESLKEDYLWKLPLSGSAIEGENILSLEKEFIPPRENVISQDTFFETEFEPLYIVGNFSVKTEGEFEELENKNICYRGEMALDKPLTRVWLSNLEQQGFSSFAGKMTVSKSFELVDTNYHLSFAKKGINAVSVRVNGKSMGDMIFSPLFLDISGALIEGTNTVELTFVTGITNALGTHKEDGVFPQLGIDII